MPPTRTLILGGGMSGLSCAYHLGSDYHLLERSDEPGGLSRSIKQDGFIYDHTGHLLHLRNPYTLKLIPELLGDNLGLHQRSAWIYSHHTYTRYPFQANTYGLPGNVIRECVGGILQARLKGLLSSRQSRFSEINEREEPESFQSWVLRTFGKGFAKHFFFPYNEKLWTVTPDILTAEWAAPFVPKPSIQEILTGALSDQTKKFGYNASFYYPKEGGIQSLAFAFAAKLNNIHLRTEVARVDLAKHEVTTSTGEIFHYDHLVTSLPLARFLALARPLPPEIESVRPLMRWTSVYNLNLGIRRTNLTDKHWIYFPEKKYRFYRVGFPMNFAPSMTPPGCSSMYIEIAHAPGHIPNDEETLRYCLRDLYDSGILHPNDDIISKKVLMIPVAYVIYDRHRTRLTQTILKFLEEQQVYSIGRFGAWKYSYMEEAILEGKETAEKIIGS